MLFQVHIFYIKIFPTFKLKIPCFFSNCEIKEPSEAVKDMNLAKILYEKSCKIVNVDKDKFLLSNETSDVSVNNSEN